MFVGRQNLSVSWVRTFIGSKFAIVLINIKQIHVLQIRSDVNSRAKVTNKRHEH